MKTKDSGQRGEIWPVAERGGGGRRMINSHAGRESRFPVAPVIMSFLNYLRRPPGLDAVIRRNEPFTEASEFSLCFVYSFMQKVFSRDGKKFEKLDSDNLLIFLSNLRRIV